MIIDTHAHYDDQRFDEDREEVLASMEASGVGLIVDVGAGVDSTKSAIALSEQYDFIYAAAGIHPDDVERLTETDMDWLRELSEKAKVVAIGEIGLDYYYETPNREIQKKWFIRQLQLAAQVQLPVIIHSRDAAEDTYELMEQYCDWSQSGVIHCFSYSAEMAKRFVEKGFYIGIGGVVTFKNSKKLKEVVRQIPLERIVLETDCPYMAPEPHRGKRNDSRELIYVVREIAALKGCPEEEVIRVTEVNAKRMYRLSDRQQAFEGA